MDNAIKVAAGLAAFMFDTLRPARPEDACKIIEVRHSASRRLRIFPCEAAILAFDDPHRRFGEMCGEEQGATVSGIIEQPFARYARPLGFIAKDRNPFWTVNLHRVVGHIAGEHHILGACSH